MSEVNCAGNKLTKYVSAWSESEICSLVTQFGDGGWEENKSFWHHALKTVTGVQLEFESLEFAKALIIHLMSIIERKNINIEDLDERVQTLINGSNVYTDCHLSYTGLKGYHHEVVKHSVGEAV